MVAAPIQERDCQDTATHRIFSSVFPLSTFCLHSNLSLALSNLPGIRHSPSFASCPSCSLLCSWMLPLRTHPSHVACPRCPLSCHAERALHLAGAKTSSPATVDMFSVSVSLDSPSGPPSPAWLRCADPLPLEDQIPRLSTKHPPEPDGKESFRCMT